MSALRVYADVPMGPLSIEIMAGGETVAQLALSSTNLSEVIPDLANGVYAVVVKRANGARLYFSVSIPDTAELNLAQDEPRSVTTWFKRGDIGAFGVDPGAFMEEEIYRGDLASTPLGGTSSGTGMVPAALNYPLAGAPGRALDSILGSRKLAATELPAAIAARRNPFAKRNESYFADIAGRRELQLVFWPDAASSRSDFSYTPVKEMACSPDFLKVTVKAARPCYVALRDSQGFGPIVTAPPFKDGVEITFLARGVASRSADRSANPSGQRTPVALATPRHAALSDLLSALASPVVEHQSSLWRDASTSLNLSGAEDSAIELLFTKSERPAEAMLAAHYLLRFLPNRLPLAWADNLTKAMPDVADGYVIAGWLRLLSSAEEVSTIKPDDIARDFGRLMSAALEKSTFLFARARALLADGLRIDAGAEHNAAHEAHLRTFLTYGAAAGGLECFWGRNPCTAGDDSPVDTGVAPSSVAHVAIRRGAFLAPRTSHPGVVFTEQP